MLCTYIHKLKILNADIYIRTYIHKLKVLMVYLMSSVYIHTYIHTYTHRERDIQNTAHSTRGRPARFLQDQSEWVGLVQQTNLAYKKNTWQYVLTYILSKNECYPNLLAARLFPDIQIYHRTLANCAHQPLGLPYISPTVSLSNHYLTQEPYNKSIKIFEIPSWLCTFIYKNRYFLPMKFIHIHTENLI